MDSTLLHMRLRVLRLWPIFDGELATEGWISFRGPPPLTLPTGDASKVAPPPSPPSVGVGLPPSTGRKLMGPSGDQVPASPASHWSPPPLQALFPFVETGASPCDADAARQPPRWSSPLDAATPTNAPWLPPARAPRPSRVDRSGDDFRSSSSYSKPPS